MRLNPGLDGTWQTQLGTVLYGAAGMHAKSLGRDFYGWESMRLICLSIILLR